MSRLCHLAIMILCGALSAGVQTGGSAEPASTAPGLGEKARLAAVLTTDAPYMQKLEACKRLAIIGDASSVAALAPLLADPQLSHAARIGLEAIPDPAAAEALRQGLTNVEGQLLVGVIHSIGARRDEQAVADLAKLLSRPDPQIASAAARALGRIGSPEAARLLEDALSAETPIIRFALGNALLACAENAIDRGKPEQARHLYDRLRNIQATERILIAAIRGLILLDGKQATEILAAELASTDNARFESAIGASRQLANNSVTAMLVDGLPDLSPDRQTLALDVLRTRGDATACPAVLEASKSPHPQVRLAAINALATVGDASVVPQLLKAATQSDPDLVSAARAALATLSDPKVDAAVANMIETPDQTMQRVAVELAGRRQIVAAVPALVKAAGSDDEQTSLAAIVALGDTISPGQLSLLTERLLAPASDEHAAAVKRALKMACARAVEKQVCAENLVTCLPRASHDQKCFFLELLGTVGGTVARKAVSEAALDENEEIQDVATRVLGAWLTPDAAPALLKIAKQSPHDKFRIRTLRGAIRVLRQMDLPDTQRLAMCHKAMQLAKRDEERILVIEALGRIPSDDALAAVVPCLETPALKAAACSAAISIGEKVVSQSPAAVADAAGKVLKATTDRELVRRANELLARPGAKPVED